MSNNEKLYSAFSEALNIDVKEVNDVGLGGGTGYRVSTTGDFDGNASFVYWTRVSVFADWIKKTTTE